MKINNIKELRDDLLKMYENLNLPNSENLQTARVKSDVAGKVIKSLQVQLSEKIRTKDSSPIEFLKAD